MPGLIEEFSYALPIAFYESSNDFIDFEREEIIGVLFGHRSRKDSLAATWWSIKDRAFRGPVATPIDDSSRLEGKAQPFSGLSETSDLTATLICNYLRSRHQIINCSQEVLMLDCKLV